MTVTTIRTCEMCQTDFTYERIKGRYRQFCDACREVRQVHSNRSRTEQMRQMRASLPTPVCKYCGRDISTEDTGGRRKSVYCDDTCKERFRAAKQERERAAAHGERTCNYCGKPLPLSKKGDAVTCNRTCGVAWGNKVRADRARAARMKRKRKPCPICGSAIDPARRRNVKFCSEACKRISAAITYRESHPDWHQTYRYGLEPGTYDAMLAAQDGRCAICGAEESGGKGGRFHIDHDHKTNEIRGLLCHRCNIGLGMMQDDLDALGKAIAYLKDPPARKR